MAQRRHRPAKPAKPLPLRVWREGQEPPPLEGDELAARRQQRLYENASLRLGYRVRLPEVTEDTWWWIVELDPRTATATVRTEMFEMPRELVVSWDQIAQSWAA